MTSEVRILPGHASIEDFSGKDSARCGLHTPATCFDLKLQSIWAFTKIRVTALYGVSGYLTLGLEFQNLILSVRCRASEPLNPDKQLKA